MLSLVIASAYVILIGPSGDTQDNPNPTEVLNLLESLVLLSSTPHTFAVSKNIFVVAFHFSGKPLGIVD